VIIFLSDGECSVRDQIVQDLARTAVRLGYSNVYLSFLRFFILRCRKALSLQAISFGQDSQSSTLRRMPQIALDIQRTAPPGTVASGAANVLSSYSVALDTVSEPAEFLSLEC
jgi:hypothetical protein